MAHTISGGPRQFVKRNKKNHIDPPGDPTQTRGGKKDAGVKSEAIPQPMESPGDKRKTKKKETRKALRKTKSITVRANIQKIRTTEGEGSRMCAG